MLQVVTWGHGLRSIPQILSNFHWIVPGEAARSAQVHGLLLRAFLEANGIRSLINLRGAHPEFGWWRREERACLDGGVRYFNAVLDSRLLPTRGMLVALWDCFDHAGAYPPLLIKCSGGQDRTSLAAALYLLDRHGWNVMDQAKAQFARFPYLHFPRPEQRWLVAFPDYAREASGGRPIGEWVRDSYDPQALGAWLDRWLGRESYAGIYPGRIK
jgi:hypothetical protein